jgi:hypothetical protein
MCCFVMIYNHHKRIFNFLKQEFMVAYQFSWDQYTLDSQVPWWSIYSRIEQNFTILYALWDFRFSWQQVWRWRGIHHPDDARLYEPLKRRSTSMGLYSTISQTAIIFILCFVGNASETKNVCTLFCLQSVPNINIFIKYTTNTFICFTKWIINHTCLRYYVLDVTKKNSICIELKLKWNHSIWILIFLNYDGAVVSINAEIYHFQWNFVILSDFPFSSFQTSLQCTGRSTKSNCHLPAVFCISLCESDFHRVIFMP